MDNSMWRSLDQVREFDVNEHLLWITSNSFEDIETPNGYKVIKEDFEKVGTLKYPRTFFVNVVPVVAELVENIRTRERGYFFAGKPIKMDKQIKL